MPLDLDVARLLKMMEIYHLPEPSDATVNEISKIADVPSLLPKKTEEFKSVKDLEFEHHGHKIPLRLYTPENAGDGIIIFFHGGGFYSGSI